MVAQSLTLSFTGQSSDRSPVDALMIEQEPWTKYTGYLTKTSLVKALVNRLYGGQYSGLVDCGMDGDQLSVAVHVYPYNPFLSYNFFASSGVLSSPVVDQFDHEEIVNIALDESAGLQYPAQEIISADWLGDVWDVDGNIIAGPDPAIDQQGIVFARPVYGALRVQYAVIRHVYQLDVVRRQAVENQYSSVVYAVYDGGLRWLEIEPPPGAEEFAAGSECGYGSGGSGSVTDESGGSIPTEVFGNRVIKKDYCSQDIIRDEVYGL